jgi:hypothetical protein
MLHYSKEVIELYLRFRHRQLLKCAIPPGLIKWVIMGLITLPLNGRRVLTDLIHRNRRHMAHKWRDIFHMVFRRAKPAYVLSCIIARGHDDYHEEHFKEAAALFLSCSTKIQNVVKYNHKDYSRQTQMFYTGVADVLAKMVFQSITEPSANSLSEEMMGYIFERFYAFSRVTQLKALAYLVKDHVVISQAKAIVNESKCASEDMKNLFDALLANHEKKWDLSLDRFSRCMGITESFAKFKIAQTILGGNAVKSFTREDGTRMMEDLKNAGYRPAILYWLEILLLRANTPQDIEKAYHKVDQCPGWEKFEPSFRGKLLRKLNHMIKQIKARLQSWQKALNEQEDRAFLHTLQEKCPPKSELCATECRIDRNKKGFEACQKEVDEAQRFYDTLRILYEAERKKRTETNVGIKRKRE